MCQKLVLSALVTVFAAFLAGACASPGGEKGQTRELLVGGCKRGGLLVNDALKFQAVVEKGCRDKAQEGKCEPGSPNEKRPYCQEKEQNDTYRNSANLRDSFKGEIEIYAQDPPVLWEPASAQNCCQVWGYKTDAAGNRIPFCVVPKSC